MHGIFAKTNRSAYPDQLRCEARGLAALREAAAGSGIDIPEVLEVDDHCLRMSRIAGGRCSPDQWSRLGKGLAMVHAQPQQRFGFYEDNYIGLNPQPNAWRDTWGAFFVEQRLAFQLGLLRDRELQRRYRAQLARQEHRLRAFLDAACSLPSLVHGDLWNGNVLCGADGRVWLIDPAVYHGDPEVDIAMTEMFGGFPAAFTTAYRSERPEPADYALRRDIYNLYHYLNHLNLFGDAYRSGCEAGFDAMERI